MDDFRGVASKIDACTVAKNLRRQQINFETLENGLLTRLSDETFRGIMNFIKAAEIDTPMDHIQKALVSEMHGDLAFDSIQKCKTFCFQ